MEEKVLKSLADMREESQVEIQELNLYLNRDDIPNWKVTELKERVRALEIRTNIIDELVSKLT